jgi:hypothetical protein
MLKQKNSNENQTAQEPPRKRVRFSDSVGVEQSEDKKSTLFHEQKKPLSDKYIRKIITKYENDPLLDLATYGITKKRLEEFFLKKSYDLLYDVVLFFENDVVFHFMIDNIPINILKETLVREEKEILKFFFGQPDTLKECGWYGEDMKEIRIKKFICLLQIDSDLIETLIKSEGVSEEVKEEYRLAQERMNKINEASLLS